MNLFHPRSRVKSLGLEALAIMHQHKAACISYVQLLKKGCGAIKGRSKHIQENSLKIVQISLNNNNAINAMQCN